MSRRRPSLHADPDESPRPWAIRLPDGQIRGPLSAQDLASMAEIGVVSATTEIASAGTENWQAIEMLPLWGEISPKRKAMSLRPARILGRPTPSKSTAVSAAPVSSGPSAMERARAYHLRETGRLLRRTYVQDAGRLLEVLGFAAAVAGCVCVGDAILFGLRPFWHSAFVLFSLMALSRLMASWFIWRIVR